EACTEHAVHAAETHGADGAAHHAPGDHGCDQDHDEHGGEGGEILSLRISEKAEPGRDGGELPGGGDDRSDGGDHHPDFVNEPLRCRRQHGDGDDSEQNIVEYVHT